MRRPQIRHENLAISPELQPATNREIQRVSALRIGPLFCPPDTLPSAGEPQQKNRNISRKDAKKRNNIYPNLAFFASWREEYPNPSV